MSFPSSFRLLGLAAALGALSLALSWPPAETQGQTPNGKPAPFTAEQKEKLKERNRLFAEILELHGQGKLRQAVARIQKVIDLEKANFGATSEGVAALLGMLAWAHEEREEFLAARKARVQALQIWNALPREYQWRAVDARLALDHGDVLARLKPEDRASLGHAKRLLDQGTVLDSQGRYAEAETVNRLALDVCRRILGDDDRETAACLNHLAASLGSQGKPVEAEALDNEALAFSLKRLGKKHPDTARSYNSVAVDLQDQAKYAAAEKLHRKALAIFLEVLGENRDAAVSCNNLALTLRERGQYIEARKLDATPLYVEAEDLDTKALAIVRKVSGDKHPDTGTSFNNLALDLLNQRQYQAARAQSRKALAIFREVLGEDHPDTANSYLNLAGCYYAEGLYARAEEQALRAAESYEAARLRISFVGLGRSAFAAKRAPGFFLASLLARNRKPAEAWKFFEESLGRGLFDDLSARYARSQGLGAAKRLEEETLQASLAGIDQRLPNLLAAKHQDSQAIAKLRRERDRLMLQLRQFQADMEAKYGPAAGKVYGLARVQDRLGDEDALVGWLDSGADLKSKDPNGEHWAVVVRNQGPPAWVKLKDASDVRRDVGRQLQDPDPTTDWEAFRADLARQRLRPLQKHLEGVKHLIVLPSTTMAGIPIEALTDRYRVSYAPSGTIYAWLREKGKVPQGTDALLALGDPTFTAEDAKLALALKNDPVARLVRGKSPKPLAGSRGEVEAIARLFVTRKRPVVKFLGLDANGPNLERLAKKRGLARFRYLHLATHGHPDPWGGMNSYLSLTPEDFLLAPEAKLSAGHILRTWQLEADLVTLSACETALGEHQGGEGYVGFAQALFFAGARTLVLSQWQANDWSTTLLMERFYQNLLGERKGLAAPLAKGEALAEAKRWLRTLGRPEVKAALKAAGIMDRLKATGKKDPDQFVEDALKGDQPFAHPHYWAAFILIGDPGMPKAKAK